MAHAQWASSMRLKDGPLNIWEGGGIEFFLPPRENNLFFFGNQRPTIFFLCFVEEFFCHMLSLLCRLPLGVFSGQHIFHKFRQQFFFSAHIFNKLFFPTFAATNYFVQFFSTPPPPDIKWCVP